MAIAQHSPLLERVRPLRSLAGLDFHSDKALIKAAQNGRPEAASQLIERHYPRILSFVGYLTNRKSQAEDLTQEVFTKALSSLQTFNGQYQFEPWLIKIARNLVIDEARKDVHRAAPTDPEDLPELESVQPDSDRVWHSMSQQIAASQVKRALAKLPIRQRTALVLREIEEMSYAEIAQVLGTNVRGVEGTLRRAKARFRLEASAAEETEGREAVCKRTLRLVALDGETPGGEADLHLRTCQECRAKSQSIKKADSLFAALPALGLTQPAWQGSLVANLVPKSEAAGLKTRLERLLDGIKDASGSPAGGALAHAAQAIAPLAVAGVISVAGVAGYEEVRERISTPMQLASPTFTQEFRADPDKMPVSYLDAHAPAKEPLTKPARSPVQKAESSTQPQNQALLGSVIELLSANLPNVPIQQLPIQSQLNLLSELPSPALAKIAETLNLPSVPTEKDALLQVIKEALIKTALAPSAGTSPDGSITGESSPATPSSSSASAGAQSSAAPASSGPAPSS